MEIGQTLYVTTRENWREWLDEHWDTASDVWLISYRKKTGKPSLAYEDAVREALCFGWIDSIRKGLDEERYVQRFSPRRPGSGYSQANRERLARLIEAGRVIPSVLEELGDIRPEEYVIPDDILAALRADPAAWRHWQRFSAPYRRIRAAYVDTARDRGEEFDKRLKTLVRRTAEGRQFGYGIGEFFIAPPTPSTPGPTRPGAGPRPGPR